VGLEGHGHTGKTEMFRRGSGFFEEGSVTEMDPVKISYGHAGPGNLRGYLFGVVTDDHRCMNSSKK
jgi:hypothetical protein